MDEALIKALKTFSTYTAGRFDVYQLAGDAKASCRQHVMSELLGTKVPRAKCGINAIREEFQKRLGATGDCIAAREGDFIKKARALLSGKTGPFGLYADPDAPKRRELTDKQRAEWDKREKNERRQIKVDGTPVQQKLIIALEEQNALLRKQLGGNGR